jgi:hypothetical protein
MPQMAVWIMLGVLAGALGTAGAFMSAAATGPASSEGNCTALILDRMTGQVIAAACAEAPPVRLEARAGDLDSYAA